MTPTAATNSNQQIDQTYSGGFLISEVVHNWPENGGGTRRAENPDGTVTTTTVAGLPIPQPSAEERAANYKTAIAAAVTLQDVKEAAALWL